MALVYRNKIVKHLCFQGVVSTLLAGFVFFYEPRIAAGLLCGAWAILLGNAFSAGCLFYRYQKNRAENTLLQYFFGKFGQFIILIVAFLLYATRSDFPIVAFLVGVLASQVLFLLASWCIKDKAKQYG